MLTCSYLARVELCVSNMDLNITHQHVQRKGKSACNGGSRKSLTYVSGLFPQMAVDCLAPEKSKIKLTIVSYRSSFNITISVSTKKNSILNIKKYGPRPPTTDTSHGLFLTIRHPEDPWIR